MKGENQKEKGMKKRNLKLRTAKFKKGDRVRFISEHPSEPVGVVYHVQPPGYSPFILVNFPGSTSCLPVSRCNYGLLELVRVSQ
jgi:hypothetical protein